MFSFRTTLLAALLTAISISSYGQVIKTVAGTGASGRTGDGGPAVDATLDHPDAVKFDKSGNMYIADERNNAIRKVNTRGIITTIAGDGTPDADGHSGPATAAHIYRPVDLAFDTKGNLYIAESGNNLISKINTSGTISILAGTGISGYNGDGGPATAAYIHNPAGLVFDSVGNLYFSAVGNYRIRKVDTAGIITTIAGTGVPGNAGDNGPATAAQLGMTGYLAFGRYKDLYIPDYFYHIVRRIDSMGVITKVAGNGAMGTNGDLGPATAACINSPYAIMFDYKHRMYISDRYDNVLRIVDTFGIINTVAGTGTAGYNGDDMAPLMTQFNTDLNCSDTDAGGNYYIADPINNRIRRISYNTLETNNISRPGRTLSFYPNPAVNTIMISSGDEGLRSLRVLDATGRTVMDKTLNGRDKQQVNISELAPGNYFLNVNGKGAGGFVKEQL